MKLAVIFDIDRTLACDDHKLHFIKNRDWDSYHKFCYLDPPIIPVINIARIMHQHYSLVFSTARQECSRRHTIGWLKKYLDMDSDFIYDNLHMRKDDDNRPSELIKLDHLIEIRKNYHVLYAFDDNVKCVEMYYNNGVHCFNTSRPGRDFI